MRLNLSNKMQLSLYDKVWVLLNNLLSDSQLIPRAVWEKTFTSLYILHCYVNSVDLYYIYPTQPTQYITSFELHSYLFLRIEPYNIAPFCCLIKWMHLNGATCINHMHTRRSCCFIKSLWLCFIQEVGMLHCLTQKGSIWGKPLMAIENSSVPWSTGSSRKRTLLEQTLSPAGSWTSSI